MRPGWSAIARRPVSTPGANEARSIESCRIVQRLPQAAEDDLLVGHHAADPQPVDPDPVDVRAAGAVERGAGGVGHGPDPASRRAAAISSAVRRAVPEGASALSGWCSSITSTDS